MAGAYTDNQPDFSWLQPYETKTFSQYWYPIQKIGPAKNANTEAAVNLEFDGETARVGVYVTSRRAVRVVLTRNGNLILDEQMDLSPEQPFIETVRPTFPAGEVSFCSSKTRTATNLIAYQPEAPDDCEPPNRLRNRRSRQRSQASRNFI